MRANPYTEGGVRLQKVLAQAGVASRRASEQMIADGRVSVDGTVVRSQGVRVDPATQVIHVDGERLILDETKHIVLAVNKPIGTVSTMSDPEGRPSIADLIADYPERLYHVGRLDIDTSGLLLLTNDGELANRLTHPKYEIRKTYVARLHGDVKPGVKRKLMNGIELEDGPIKVDAFRIVDTYGDITTVEIVVHEGRNRLVRRMMEAVGYPVRELVRTGFGPISLDHLKQGTTRRPSACERTHARRLHGRSGSYHRFGPPGCIPRPGVASRGSARLPRGRVADFSAPCVRRGRGSRLR